MAGTASTSGSKAPTPGTHNSTEENRVLELCEQFKEGITITVLMNDMPTLSQVAIVQVLNKLLVKGKLELLRRADDTLLYKLKDPVTQHMIKGINKEEQAVYEVIERSGSFGIWARKIRTELNLHVNTVDKVLKRLETKKLIKSIKSVQASKKKMYLLANVEPDLSLTGGAFYNGTEFDSACVNIVMDICFKFMEKKLHTSEKENKKDGPLVVVNAAKVTAKELHEYIEMTKLLTVKLTVEEVDGLLDAMVLDGRVACYEPGCPGGGEGVKMWRFLPDWCPTPQLLSAPCGMCDLIERCSDHGAVSPQSCEYMNDWLS